MRKTTALLALGCLAAAGGAGAEIRHAVHRGIPRDAGRRQPGRAVRGQGRGTLEAEARAEERLARDLRPGQGARAWSRAPSSSCRATSPTRSGCRTWRRAWSPAWRRCRDSTRKEIAKTPFGKGEQANVTALATWIAAESKGLKFNLPQAHPQEREFVRSGQALFFMRGGPHDFSCASCHGEDGKRIRLQDLPNLTKNPGDGVGFARLAGLPRVQRPDVGHAAAPERLLPPAALPLPGSAATRLIALATYLGVNAKGAKSIAPAIKR